MPVDAKPLFRPDVLRPLLTGFQLPTPVEQLTAPLRRWAEALASRQADSLNERELLPDFLTDIFCGVLGYTRIVDNPTHDGARLIDVDILGHIFEQSITDLERLRNELEGRAAPETRAERVSRRKRPAGHLRVCRYRRGIGRPRKRSPASRTYRRRPATVSAPAGPIDSTAKNSYRQSHFPKLGGRLPAPGVSIARYPRLPIPRDADGE